MARLRRTVTTDLDRARVADQMQLWRRKRFSKFRDPGDCSRRGRDRNRYRDDVATCRRIFGVHMRSAVIIVVVMDGRTMMMVAVV